MAGTRSRLVVWLCLLCVSAAVVGSPLPHTTRPNQTPPNGANNDQTLPLIELSTSSVNLHSATTTTVTPVENQIESQTVENNDHSLPKYLQQSKTGTLATYTSKDSTVETGYVTEHHQTILQTPKYPCTTDKECHPPNSSYSISSSLVYCDNTTWTCVCNDCFALWNDTCTLKRCYRFDDGHCTDIRKSQTTLLALSVFLSSTGAANLYIGQEGLGYAQLSLLLFTCLCCCCIYCVKKCFVECCTMFSDECDCYEWCEDFWMCCHDLCASLCVIFCAVSVFLSCIVMVAWWAADIAGFVENKKLDGDGCPLTSDL